MRRPLATLVLFVGVATAALSVGQAAKAAELDSLTSALAEVDQLLERASNGKEWRSYLLLDQLRTDPNGPIRSDNLEAGSVKRVVQRLQADSPYLERPEFIGLRKKLELALADDDAAPSLPAAAGGNQDSSDETFVKPNDGELAAAEGNLQAAFADLEKYLDKIGKKGEGWVRYLEDAGVHKQRLSDLEDNSWRIWSKKLLADKQGNLIGVPEFVNLRKAVAKYGPLRLASLDETANEYPARLARLRQALAQHDGPAADRDEAERIVRQEYKWLADRHQAAGLLAEIRQKWFNPNLYVLASEYVISSGAERQTVEPTYIHENILGTDVRGSGITQGSTRISLVPNKQQATFDMLTTGVTNASTVGRNGTATILSHSTTSFQATKRVYATPNGLSSTLAQVLVNTNSNPYSVSSGRGHGGIITRIADRVAWDRVGQSKAAAEAESTRRSQYKIQNRIEQETANRLADGNRRLGQRYRYPMLEGDTYPAIYRYSTTTHYAQMTQLQARGDELGAPTKAPPVRSAFDFAMLIHESLLENYYREKYAGEIKEQRELRSDFAKLLSEEELKARFPGDDGNGSGDNTILFDNELPLSVRFSDGGYTVTINAQEFKLGEAGNAPESSAQIIADYEFQLDEKGFVVARRTGLRYEIQQRNEGIRDKLLKSLSKSGEQMFKETEQLDPLELSGNFKKAGKLRMTYRHVANGWLVMAWIRPAYFKPQP
ncbi:MAG: hypothetical protein AB7O62_25820 [Pirellulales bacterium]